MQESYKHHPPNIDDITQRNIDTIARMERLAERDRTFGNKVADRFASIVGSWKFIIIQSCILVAWVILNVIGFIQHWDPYPFILLNLALSFQAAYASPIIMMSQNRQARLDERRNHLDLQINLLAEQESTEALRLLRLIARKHGIVIRDADEAAFEQETKPDKIIEEIEQRVEAYETHGKKKGH
jgi:uncharacterized membrane protein